MVWAVWRNDNQFMSVWACYHSTGRQKQFLFFILLNTPQKIQIHCRNIREDMSSLWSQNKDSRVTLVLYIPLHLGTHSLVVKWAVIFKTKGKWIKLQEGENFHLLMSLQRVDFTHNLAKWYQGISTVAKYKKYNPHKVITGYIMHTVSRRIINQCETVSSHKKISNFLQNYFCSFSSFIIYLIGI